jgi:glutathione S-transferase kappa 1
VKIIIEPFFLGGVMNASGNTPPATLPSKAAFLNLDLARNSKLIGGVYLRIIP